MHPIVIVVLIFVALGAVYFLMNNLQSAQVAATGMANQAVVTYGTLVLKVLMVAVALYGIYYVVEVVRGAVQQRKAINRLRNTDGI